MPSQIITIIIIIIIITNRTKPSQISDRQCHVHKRLAPVQPAACTLYRNMNTTDYLQLNHTQTAQQFGSHRTENILPYKDQPVNAARGKQSLCIVGIICNAQHGRMNVNTDGTYTYHCLHTLTRNTDNNHTMHGYTVYISPNYSTRTAHTIS
jgi:hypothetical protein